MTARILDGRSVSAAMRRDIAADVAALKARGVTPGLGVVLVGDNPASRSYVSAKEKACAEAGIYSREEHLAAGADLRELAGVIDAMNEDPRIDGILVQFPLPDATWEEAAIGAVRPDKDVDGFHPLNVGRMMLGLPAFLPCTPHGILQLLKRSAIPVSGRHVVVVGRSNIVGRPLANMLSQKNEFGNATVTLCHTGTRDLAAFTRQADILVAAVGRPASIKADMVRDGAVVIDVGVNRIGGKLVGDVDFDAVVKKASAITPVPGGVGPMTITMLLHNTVWSAKQRPGAR